MALVTLALNAVNTLNTGLGGFTGTSVSINGSTTINASTGTDRLLNGQHYSVFTVTGFNTTNNDVLTINGDGSGRVVVLNFSANTNFNNQVVLNGLTSDQVLYNFVGGSNLTGGPALQINNQASLPAVSLVIFWTPTGPST